jgi:hypothetical protein
MLVTQTTLEDESHLNILAVFHYVIGGFCVLGIGFLILQFVMMSLFFQVASDMPSGGPTATVAIEKQGELASEAEPEISGDEEAPGIPEPAITTPGPAAFPGFPREMMVIFIGFYVAMGAILAVIATANFMSGRFIKKRRNKTFSLVVSGFNCLQMPFGTVLGVFTIIVLSALPFNPATKRTSPPKGFPSWKAPCQ